MYTKRWSADIICFLWIFLRCIRLQRNSHACLGSPSPFLSLTGCFCSLLFICRKAPGQVNIIYQEPLAYLMPSVKGRLHILLSFWGEWSPLENAGIWRACAACWRKAQAVNLADQLGLLFLASFGLCAVPLTSFVTRERNDGARWGVCLAIVPEVVTALARVAVTPR